MAKIRQDAPFDKVCYIGCGVTTGIGAVLNTAKVEPGAKCAVFGLGGIGLNVVQGARLAGAAQIVGVDVNPSREKLARELGMTHFVNPKNVQDVVGHVVELACHWDRSPVDRGSLLNTSESIATAARVSGSV